MDGIVTRPNSGHSLDAVKFAWSISIVVSLALNVLLTTFYVRRDSVEDLPSFAEFEEEIYRDAEQGVWGQEVAPEEPVVALELSTDELLSASDDDWMKLADVLREAGLSEKGVRALLHGAVFSEWQEGLIARQLEERQGKFWNPLAALRIEEIQAMLRERSEVEAHLAGFFGEALPPLLTASSERILPPTVDAERARLLQDLEEEFALLEQSIESSTRWLKLPEDDDACQFLKAERRNDLAALLSPEELADYLLQNEDAGKELRRELRYMEPTAEELRQLYWMEEDFKELHSGLLVERKQVRREAMGEILGEERMNDYDRSQGSYGRARAVADRFGIDREIADGVWSFIEREESDRALLEPRESQDPMAALPAQSGSVPEMLDAIERSFGDAGRDLYLKLTGGPK